MVSSILGQPEGVNATAQKALESLPKQASFLRALAVAAMAVASQMEGNSSYGLELLKDELKNPGLPSSIQARIWFYLTIVNYLDVNATDTLNSSWMALKIAEDFNLAHSRGISRYFLAAIHHLRNELKEAKSWARYQPFLPSWV